MCPPPFPPTLIPPMYEAGVNTGGGIVWWWVGRV